MNDRASLASWFGDADRVLLGYSGGVDSAVLAVVGAATLGDRFLAVIGRSESFPEVQWRQARALADRFAIPVLEVATAELADPAYRANSPDRCYFCKRELWSRLGAVAVERGFPVVIDGTHADDLGEHRPGARAGRERAIRSPFVELGWSKADVRTLARQLDLPIWDAPASPCLASRIQYGLEVTGPRLGQVEAAEAFLRGLGVAGDLRVRHHGDRARIEAGSAMFPLLDARRVEIETAFAALGFAAVERDPRGYRRGSLLPVAS